MSKLRDDFLWGGAVTAHQTEGAYDQDGKVPAVCDLLATPGKSTFKEGIDSYHRFDEDFALLEKLDRTMLSLFSGLVADCPGWKDHQ